MKTIIDYQNDEREKVLLDVRDKQEFEKETYPGARNWYWEELIKVLEETPEEFTQQFDKSVPIYLLCYTGLHSDDLADILEDTHSECAAVDHGGAACIRRPGLDVAGRRRADRRLVRHRLHDFGRPATVATRPGHHRHPDDRCDGNADRPDLFRPDPATDSLEGG